MGARPNGQWPEVNGTVPGRPIRALAGSWRGAGQCTWLAAWAWVVTVDLGPGALATLGQRTPQGPGARSTGPRSRCAGYRPLGGALGRRSSACQTDRASTSKRTCDNVC